MSGQDWTMLVVLIANVVTVAILTPLVIWSRREYLLELGRFEELKRVWEDFKSSEQEKSEDDAEN